jgi:tetratricopeptide (TPR) repeat protein
MDQGEVRRLFLTALDLEPECRSAFLEAMPVSPETRKEVLALLEHEPGSETFFEKIVSRELPDHSWVTRQFGPYRVVELLARGGMGAVFKAERADGELAQVVAIKVVAGAWFDSHALERFRRERQFLANLVHPNIARLLDGGTQNGVAYLVMEYVEGLRLDEYCARHELGVAERLRLFLPLCGAVEYAHQKLIVHRDLKPSNVLVTPGGEPKLLDFGVAKALDSNADGRTQTLMLTPEYASPEQVRGDEITTGTDVYGLGAVLYQLLTGHPPHRVETVSPGELYRAVCQNAPLRPGEHRSELKGDLENILLRALHPEPQRRYGSVRELADDIERYRKRLPVRATPDSYWYRARRFIGRHTVAAAAAGLAFCAIAGATAVSVYEAHRAQLRFEQVHKLASRFLFDFESSIRDVPGTLEARKMMAGTAREYLANLERDSRGNARLTRELAEAHYRLSRVEASMSESEAGLQDLDRALALWREAGDDCCGTAPQRRVYISALTDAAHLRYNGRNPGLARQFAVEALRRSRDWVRSSPDQPEAQRSLVDALLTSAWLATQSGRDSEERELLTEALDRAARIPQSGLNDDAFAYSQAEAANALARLCSSLRDAPCEAKGARRAREILDRLIERQPHNAPYRNLRIRVTANWAMALRRMAEKDESFRAESLLRARESFDYAEAETRNDPRNIQAADLALVMRSRLALQLQLVHRYTEALALFRKSGTEIQRLIALEPANRRFHYLRINNLAAVGDLLVEIAQWQQADRVLAEAEQAVDRMREDAPHDEALFETDLDILTNRSKVALQFGQAEVATARCRHALTLAADAIRQDPAQAQAIAGIGELRRLARRLNLADPTLSP